MYNAAMRRAQTLGGAFDTAVNTMYERQQQQQALAQAKAEEDKAFNSKLKALEALLQSHKDKFKLDENQLKQFLSTDPSESPKNRYGRIAGFVEGTMKAAELEKTQAEALKARTPPPMEGQPMTMQQIEDLRAKGYDVNAVPTSNPNVVMVKGISPRAAQAAMPLVVLNRGATTTVVDPTNPTKVLAEYPNISVGQGQMVVQQGAGAPAAPAAPAAPPVSLPQFLPSGSMRPGATPSPQAQAAAQFAGPARPAPVASAPAPAPAAEAGLPRVVDLPGGKAAAERQAATLQEAQRLVKQQRAASNVLAGIKQIEDNIDKEGIFGIETKLGPKPVGMYSSLRKAVNPAANAVAAGIDTIIANIGFEELISLKDVGGTLGQVAVRELELLQRIRGSLDQNLETKEFKRTVTKLKDEAQETLARVKILQNAAAEGRTDLTPAEIKQYQSLGGTAPKETVRMQWNPNGMGQGTLSTPVEATAAGLKGVDRQAYEWALKNPNDPRADAIKKRLGL
jgi:hypothetical protein